MNTKQSKQKPPPIRFLRGFAVDPSLSTTLETVGVNEAMYQVPWEDLEKGPVGEYLEVVDYDPATGRLYEPVDLNDGYILAQDGIAPSESDPQAHQQMVYAVAMTTIKNFEKALGRRVLWAERRWKELVPAQPRKSKMLTDSAPKEKWHTEYVPRLRIYPHALRGANAFYSPQMVSLLFGYFPVEEADEVHAPGSTVFTCLSHDIVAHETTHALLDGMSRRFASPNQPDALAFHEAFADMVALFQHFTFPSLLEHQIAKTRGNLAKSNMLGQLAQEFGRALGKHGALRDALGKEPDPAEIDQTFEPHARGAILVAAVFEAFTRIYDLRAKSIIALATGGTGELPPGQLQPGLIKSLSAAAAKTAGHFLTMVIRALDYCPPVGLTFGDYLRALVTADADMVEDDKLGYRVALVDAFRRRGIFPPGVRSLSEEALLWPNGGELDPEVRRWLLNQLRDGVTSLRYAGSREELYYSAKKMAAVLHGSPDEFPPPELVRFAKSVGLELDGKTAPKGIKRSPNGVPKFEVHQFRPALRGRPDGMLNNHAIVTLTQRAWVETNAETKEGYFFRGGVTLIFELDTMTLKWCISKPIDDRDRQAAYEAYMRDHLPAEVMKRFSSGDRFEPFAFLHGDDWRCCNE